MSTSNLPSTIIDECDLDIEKRSTAYLIDTILDTLDDPDLVMDDVMDICRMQAEELKRRTLVLEPLDEQPSLLDRLQDEGRLVLVHIGGREGGAS